ncbi:hypothetical protein POSPLADRAFT_1146725 [Postia placenta MAD-698-R-SB12]|uniref:Uncharacterized protein n=1 Tax=Postia placenta MAD-698-R-SB12 TaxID=670580 RepID=A0A1X6MYR6_9APHY|nr:hypothetical protein POSPLADRAFT_1146725 [Postia placenta MAD-698-R-SB12]OSX61333.1 hypothetical protein POSPLADRAFT_1146725 [Postia placenta MAD-698-R-SB12]
MFNIRAAEHLPRKSTPALSDDTGSSSSRESSPPATSVSGLSRAPSISFDYDFKHEPTGDGTYIRTAKPDADSSPSEDITLKRRRIYTSSTARVSGTPSLEYVSRPLKQKLCADTSTDDACAKRAWTSSTSSDATKAKDSASFGQRHILVRKWTKITVAEPDAAPAVTSNINLRAPLETMARPPKRKRCADTTTDEVRVKRRLLSDGPSDASKLKEHVGSSVPIVLVYYLLRLGSATTSGRV